MVVLDAPEDGLDVVYLNGDYNSFVNRKLLELGLSVEVCKDLLNPGFEDPFDISTTTLEPDFMKCASRAVVCFFTPTLPFC